MEVLTPAKGVNIKDFDPVLLLGFKHWRISEKVDGVRRLFYKTQSNKVLAYSNTNKEDPWLSHICDWMTQSHFPNNMIYDCELVDRESYFDIDKDSFLRRIEASSKASQEYPDNKGDLMAVCFDMVRPGGDMATGKERTALLEDTFRGLLLHEPIIQIPIFGYIYGAEEMILSSLMDLVGARRGEGLMLMNLEAPYIPGRSNDIVKIKRLQEFVGTVINYEMGREDSKIAGGIAALICDVPGCSTPVRVGTGFTNAMRKEMADDRIIGTKVEIESFGMSWDKNGDTSLNMPVFKQLAGV